MVHLCVTQEEIAMRGDSFDDWSVNLAEEAEVVEDMLGGSIAFTNYEVVNDYLSQSTSSSQAANSGDDNVPSMGSHHHHHHVLDKIPPQLHPAVSMGMRRASSCYFSVHSQGCNTFAHNKNNSMLDLLSLWEDEPKSAQGSDESETLPSEDVPQSSWTTSSSSSLLYHDILMNVFTFLDMPSLSAVSETTLRLNFEVFYFLELQLQRALIPGGCVEDDSLSCIAGVSRIQRLAKLNRPLAETLVQEFLDSNASLRHMPLSHSLAYMRQVFQNNTHFPHPSSQALASAALIFTFLGAATTFHVPDIVASSDFPNMLFRVGFVGSLMGAATSISETPPEKLREHAEHIKLQAERLAMRLQEAILRASNMQPTDQQQGAAVVATPFPSWSQLVRMAHAAAHGHGREREDSHRQNFLFSHDPYAHISTEQGKEDEDNNSNNDNATRKTPTGCVGAYFSTVGKARRSIAEQVRKSRRQRFLQFTPEERQDLTRRLLEACSNDALETVRTIVHNGVDADGFYVGEDGSETCALHTASLNGATAVLDFLCAGPDDETDTKDGGLCVVNRRDANAWTALHFASGSNSVEAIRILVKHGADWTVEANNGYTPYQWAKRLQHHEAAQELQDLASRHSRLQSHTWIVRQPLAVIAGHHQAFGLNGVATPEEQRNFEVGGKSIQWRPILWKPLTVFLLCLLVLLQRNTPCHGFSAFSAGPPYLAVITEPDACLTDLAANRTYDAIAQAASDGKVDLISIRHGIPSDPKIKCDVSDRIVALTTALMNLSPSSKFLVVLSSDWLELTERVRVHGIHVKEAHRQKILEIRNKLGPDLLIGTSAHSVPSAVDAWQKYMPDYFFVGTCFVTQTHPEKSLDDLEGPALPGEVARALKELCAQVKSPPVFAIGGINAQNCHEPVKVYGADGVATIRAVLQSRNPAQTVSEMKQNMAMLVQ